ncbi:hypothetical protein V5N11_025602 [Cardamine amara subsp. amara]|uniref:Uncharacterized protein n=1 Tax=Cardamine amara subsp. amara TaxID=228776 RepID=A0ABD1C917_CARAN
MTDQKCDINKIIGDLTELENELKNIPTFKIATVKYNNEQTSERRSEEKRSLCDRVIGIFKKAKTEASNHASESRRGKQNTDEDADFEIRKLQNDIRQMKAAFVNLTEFQKNMKINLERDLPLEKLRAILKKTDIIKSRSQDLKETRRKVFNLKCEIPSLLNKQSSRWLSLTDSQTAEENDEINEDGQDIYLPSLHVSEDFKVSPAFEEILEKFEELDFNQKLCLLSFAVFPENREIKRTMLMYWWIGEEFIPYADSEGFISYAKSENLVTI